MHSHGTMKVSDSPHHLCSSRIYQFPPKATLLNMFRIVHRSVILTRRPNHPATRRFNTSGPAAEGSAQGAMPPPPPPPHGDWARRLNEYEHRYKHFAARVNGTGDRKWIGKGPIIGFVGGVLVGSSLFSKRDHGDERTERRIKSLASDLQDESRKLKQQLVSIQQSIDQLKVATPAYAPYPSRPHV
ncbi:hypothetical protein, variant [Aphanomyces astaci]|nr:hypothetical protein, variant [Aphanomyces astaci]ETV84399.1 hypothetical protein, variant [Aphanomyces astaci]|eukprot:XP_009826091.1 hypothetical protein, variant [Aphanomyces astaci]